MPDPDAQSTLDAANLRMPVSAWRVHQALLSLMGDQSLDDAIRLGELLVIRSTAQAAITTITDKIQREHPGVLT